MSLVNFTTRELTCKIVYYGPGRSGKTTNLQYIYGRVPDERRGRMVSLATQTDRTLFFDFLPLELGLMNMQTNRNGTQAGQNFGVLRVKGNVLARSYVGAILTDTELPSHRLWLTPDHRALFAGADQKRPPDRLRDKTLVQRTGQLMYELSRLYPAISGAAPAFGWDVPLAHPVDGVLYAGAHRNFPHHLFAFGTSHDPARAYLASRILARGVIGKAEKEDEFFSFARNL